MSEYQVQPARRPLDAVVTLPGSKSITNRALVAAALADGNSVLSGLLLAEDTRLMIGALGALGIAVTVDEGAHIAEVTGCRGHLPENAAALDCGNSGTTMRFCTALAAVGQGEIELDGAPRMHERPIAGLVDGLRSLGAGVEYVRREGFPPLMVHGRGLEGGQVSFHSPTSSQWVSGLLLVAPYAQSDVLVDVTGEVPSLPYLKMTTAIMDQFGVAVIEQYGERIEASTAHPRECRFIVAAPQRYVGTNLTIEPDASNAAYFLSAPALVGGRVSVEGIGAESVQGDVRFVNLLEKMGCRVERAPRRLTVLGLRHGELLRGIDVDLADIPDTAQTLAVLALFADGPTIIRNVANLRLKETDRLAALTRELAKLGAGVDETPDGLTIHPPKQVTPAAIDTYNDHRMAMSFALAGLKCPGVVIRDAECCAKTFPDFFQRLEGLTANLL